MCSGLAYGLDVNMLMQIGLSCGLKCISVRSEHNVTNVMLLHTANLIHFQTTSDVPLSAKSNAPVVSLMFVIVSDSLLFFYLCVK